MSIPDKTGRLASYRITEPGLARLVIETDDVYSTIVEIPADVLAGIVAKADHDLVTPPDMRCLLCGHPVEYKRGDLVHADLMTHAYQHTASLDTHRPDPDGETGAPLLPYALSDEGHLEGVSYVTVLDAGGNPIEYNIPRSDAVARYAAELDA